MIDASIDSGYRLLAAKHIAAQAKQLAAQLNSIRKADGTEPVHRARVASRRLRAWMQLCGDCLPEKTARRWRRCLRRLTRGLGPARDRDVQIAFLYDHLAGLEKKDCYPGIVRLLGQLESEREDYQSEVLSAVDRFAATGVLDEMLVMAKPILAEAKANRTPPGSPFVFRKVGEAVLRQVAKLREYEDSLADAKDLERHHAMRIAAKRLRYTLEIAATAYDGRLDESIATAKQLQTLLGALHDCDVCADLLGSFKAAERNRLRKVYGGVGPYAPLRIGIENLLRQCRRQRKGIFRELGDYWKGLEQRRWLPRDADLIGKAGTTGEGDNGGTFRDGVE